MTGRFGVYYDDTSGIRHLLASLPSAQGDEPVSVAPNAKTGTVTLPAQPNAAEPGKYTVVFRGVMGNEADAVVGRVVEQPKWREEWSRDFGEGAHAWALYNNHPHVSAIVQDGRLVMENSRPAGDEVYFNDKWSLAGLGIEETNAPTEIVKFPLQVRADQTTLTLKIDEMSVAPWVPYQSCTGLRGSVQSIAFRFSDNLGRNLRVVFTKPDQAPHSEGCMVSVTEGTEQSVNVAETLNACGMAYAEPLRLWDIVIGQSLTSLCTANTQDEKQRLVVDHIRMNY